MSDLPKRLETISREAWGVMQEMRNGDYITLTFETGEIAVGLGPPIKVGVFDQLLTAGLIRREGVNGRFETYRITDHGWAVAAGDEAL